MSTPIVGRNALIKIDTTQIAYCTGVEIGIKRDPIKKYDFGASDPAFLEAGNSTYTFKIETLYTDKTHATLITGGTKFSLVILPSGSGDTYTLANCVLIDWNKRTVQDDCVLEDCSGEGMSITLPT